MFTIRWRWNATRSLAVPRFRGGAKIAAPLQRMESGKSFGRSFPDQLACLEHIVGDREIPDHPLVKQTIDDCLTDAMDIDGLEEVLRRIDGRRDSLCRARFAGAVAARSRDPECAAVRISRQRTVGRTADSGCLHATCFREKRQ
jgi:hypothetical protein